MGRAVSVSDLLKLSVSRRIQLVEDVWDSIVHVPEAVVVTDKQKKELDQRLEAYHNDPSTGSPWSRIKNKLLASKK